VVTAQAAVAEFVATFKKFPPRQKPSSFSVDQIMEQLEKPQSNWDGSLDAGRYDGRPAWDFWFEVTHWLSPSCPRLSRASTS
jgi:hypothetical protein